MGLFKFLKNNYDSDEDLKDLEELVYEDENVLFINKPVGMLSQKADKNDCSLVEYITAYLLHNNSLTYEDLAMFTPSICNRLDRNTSGIIAAGNDERLAGAFITF